MSVRTGAKVSRYLKSSTLEGERLILRLYGGREVEEDLKISEISSFMIRVVSGGRGMGILGVIEGHMGDVWAAWGSLYSCRIVEEDLKIPKIRSFIIRVVIRGSMGSRGHVV